MTLINRSSFCCLILSLCLVPLYGQNASFQKAHTAAQKYVNKKSNKALVVAIIKDGKSKVLSYGNLSNNNKLKPDGNTLFEIGSVTNVFTTTLMKLEEKNGLFKMEDRIQDHFTGDINVPTFRPEICIEERIVQDHMTPHEMKRSIVYCIPVPMTVPKCITFCHLASHTSGFPSNPRGLYSWNPLKIIKQKKDPYQDFSKAELYDNMRKAYLNAAPGSVYYYSNWGIAILGNLVADIANQPYEALLTKQILDPLNLKDTRITLSPTQANRLAIGHSRKGDQVDPWHFKSMAPALGLKSSANDLSSFVIANLSTNIPSLEDAFAHVQQSQIATNEKKLGRFGHMGYGWYTSRLNEATNLPIQWINGGTGGFRSFIGFNKDTQTGVVILSNSANDVDELGFLFLEGLVKVKNRRIVNN